MTTLIESTFLTKDQIWGYKALDVMNSYGTKVIPTDLAFLLGVCVSDIRASKGDLSCDSWSISSYHDCYVRTVSIDGTESYNIVKDRRAAARPVLLSSITSGIHPNVVKEVTLSNGNRVQVGQWGEYPQTVACDSISQELEKNLQTGRLKTTGKHYTFDSTALKDYDVAFKERICQEYEFKGNGYIRIQANPAYNDSILSNGRSVKEGDAYWVQVEPIDWLMDKTGIWVSRNALFAGILFDITDGYSNDFSKTFMKSYLDKYFVPEMIQHTFSHEDKNKIIQQVKEMDVEEIGKIPQQDPDLLNQLIIVGGLLEEAFEQLSYEQKKALYSKTYNHTSLAPKRKKAMEQSILKSRSGRQN